MNPFICNAIKFFSLLVVVLHGSYTFASPVNIEELDELVATINSFETLGSLILLEAHGQAPRAYHVFPAARLQKANGEPLALNNLHVGDTVSVVVDRRQQRVRQLTVLVSADALKGLPPR